MIETLPLLEPDTVRRARTLARCRQELARRRRRSEVVKPTPHPNLLAVERVVVAGFLLFYLAAVLEIAASIPPLG